jgi:hypothetical protein
MKRFLSGDECQKDMAPMRLMYFSLPRAVDTLLFHDWPIRRQPERIARSRTINLTIPF